jgi:Domain of unknown function (DUF4214)
MRPPSSQVRAVVTAVVIAACCLGVFVSSGPVGARATGTTGLVLQQMDSCKQALGGAAYELTGSGVDIQGSAPSQTKQPVAQSSTCPLQQGDCSRISVGCITLDGVPYPGTYRIHETRTPDADQSNPEGYAACNGGSACRSQVVDVDISASGGVQARVTNVYPDGVSATYPTAAQHSGSSSYAGTGSDPIVVHNFGLAPPSSNRALQCDGDSDADDHLTGSPSSHCAYPESEESSACQPYPWSCTLGVTGSSGSGDASGSGSPSGSGGSTGGSSAGPLSGSSAAFVGRLYQDLLGRAAGPAEVSYWSGRMAAGTGRDAVAAAVLNSPELHGHVVDGDYQLLLGRGPDGGGRAYWVSVLGGGADNEAVEAGFAGSNEYFASRGRGTSAGFVQALYHDFLGRTATSAEAGYWTGRLASGMSRVAVATGFTFSHENHVNLVSGWYRRDLGRSGDPGGVAYWAAYLDRGGRDETIEAGLLGSAEYLARASS